MPGLIPKLINRAKRMFGKAGKKSPSRPVLVSVFGSPRRGLSLEFPTFNAPLNLEMHWARLWRLGFSDGGSLCGPREV